MGKKDYSMGEFAFPKFEPMGSKSGRVKYISEASCSFCEAGCCSQEDHVIPQDTPFPNFEPLGSVSGRIVIQGNLNELDTGTLFTEVPKDSFDESMAKVRFGENVPEVTCPACELGIPKQEMRVLPIDPAKPSEGAIMIKTPVQEDTTKTESNSFLQALRTQSNLTTTENGAVALKSTGSDLLNLFGVAGALRSRQSDEIATLFGKAFKEDALLATKMVFYARNVRGGLGERDVPRLLWKLLAQVKPEIMEKNLPFVPLFGRWDDMYIFVGTPLEPMMWGLIQAQLKADIISHNCGDKVSLLAKWLKSPNTSSPESRRLGKLTAKVLGLSEKKYRQILTALRADIDVPEVKMSAKRWGEIKYSAVPSKAMANYRKAFKKQDADRFQAFIEALKKGETKVNASTLYPYDILAKMGLEEHYGYGWNDSNFILSTPDDLLELQWKALPNYVEGENNILVMADTSGSMLSNAKGRPLQTSLGLALYFAERNKGVFKDTFMTFSERPSLVTLTGETLAEKVACIPSIVDNTNLEAAFNLILDSAKNNNLSQDEIPKALIVISDMEIDQCSDVRRRPFYDIMAERFANAGYEIPNIVFWNVESRQDVFHANSGIKGVQLASGSSVSTFKSVLANLGKNPYEAMVTTLNDPLYDCITI